MLKILYVDNKYNKSWIDFMIYFFIHIFIYEQLYGFVTMIFLGNDPYKMLFIINKEEYKKSDRAPCLLTL